MKKQLVTRAEFNKGLDESMAYLKKNISQAEALSDGKKTAKAIDKLLFRIDKALKE